MQLLANHRDLTLHELVENVGFSQPLHMERHEWLAQVPDRQPQLLRQSAFLVLTFGRHTNATDAFVTAQLEGERITVQEALVVVEPNLDSVNDVDQNTDWKSSVQGYNDYLVLERGLSKNSVLAYMRDIKQFMEFAVNEENVQAPMDIELPHVERFLGHLYDRGLARNSQARMLSGVRSFCKYLRIEGVMDSDPIQLIQAPRPERKLPDVLSVEEIERIIGAVDMSRREGVRNKAMLEVLYSCGLRVSELIDIQLSKVDLIDGVVG